MINLFLMASLDLGICQLCIFNVHMVTKVGLRVLETQKLSLSWIGPQVPRHYN